MMPFTTPTPKYTPVDILLPSGPFSKQVKKQNMEKKEKTMMAATYHHF